MDLFAPNHLILIALIVLLLFGGKKIPELMRGLGRGVREFNDAKSNVRQEIENSTREREQPVNTTATTPTNTTTTTTQP
jgi:sec-independent protein translocase protein TatA